MYRYVLSYVSCLSCTFMWSSNYALLYMVIYSLMHASDCLGVLCMLVADVLAELLQPWAYASTYASLCTAMWTSSYASTWSCTTHASDLLCGHYLMHSYLCIRCVMQRLTHTSSCKFMRTSTYLCVHAVMLSYAMCDELCNVMQRLWIAFLMRTYVWKCMSCTLMQLGSYALFALCMSCSFYVYVRRTCCYT